MPIENQEIPISYAPIPIVTILTFEVVMSVVQMKYPKLKNLVSTRPSALIEKGEINQKELERSEYRPTNLSGSCAKRT